MIERAIVTVNLAEDVFCHMVCKCTQINKEHTRMTVESFYKVDESQYGHFAKMMMSMKDNEEEIIHKLFNEIEGRDELTLMVNDLIITYYREIQPQGWT